MSNNNILDTLEVVQRVCLGAALYFLALGATATALAVCGAMYVGLI
jgi:hypothetical protein